MAQGDVRVHVFVENLAPDQGTFLTPVWVGFHDGGFDTYDRGRPVSLGVERIAEDGNPMLLSDEFLLSGFGTLDGVLGAGPIAPGDLVTQGFVLNDGDATHRFFNYASMIIPSNDAWIANGSETANPLFNQNDKFTGLEILVRGENVLDAGSEVNDEIPENTAFFGQTEADTGDAENGVVRLHEGFLPAGSGGILDDPRFANADFTQDDYQIAKITVSKDILGNDRRNTLNGTNKAEWIDGRGGNDRIDGRDGSDLIFGGDGKDKIEGGDGNDKIYGEAGTDILEGGEGNDSLYGGFSPTDALPLTTTFEIEESQEVTDTPIPDTRSTGTVTIAIEDGVLSLDGSFRNLTSSVLFAHIHFGERGINGPVFQDLEVEANLSGKRGTLGGEFSLTEQQLTAFQNGEYYVNLHTQNNPGGELRGQVEFDLGAATRDKNQLFGEEGDDILIGDVGDDHLVGGEGFDTVFGAAGADEFVLSPNSGADLILDFQDGIDKIRLKDFSRFRFSNLSFTQGTSDDPGLENKNNTLIAYRGDVLAAVVGVTPDIFSREDFVIL
jgi:Ca2+-binding RTX toxin-like protein